MNALGSIPTLITIGRYDQVSQETAVEVKKAMVRVFENSSHCIWFEEPEEYKQVLRAYLFECGHDSCLCIVDHRN